MALFKGKNAGGIMDVIRCDKTSYLIWKWHPKSSSAGNSRRENSIRWGSSLRVKEGEAAIFVYKAKDDEGHDIIIGPYDGTLKTANLPFLARIVGLAYDGASPFQAEVYFINLAQIEQVKFGVPFFDVYDPRFADFGVPVAVRGTISFNISDAESFIKLHRLRDFSPEEFLNQIRDAVCRYVKDAVANAPAEHDIPVVQLEAKIAPINDSVEYVVKERLHENFGVTVSGFDIGAIEIDKASEGYNQLMKVTRDISALKTKADIQDYIERLRIQREEGQYSQHKQTQSANFAVYQTEAQTQVGIAGAEALGKMGANGAGGVNMGGVGFNPAAMVAGMALGSAVGQNIASTVGGILNGNHAPAPGAVPPPLPTSSYHVAINGQAAGPFDIAVLKQMALSNQFSAESLVWKQGMAQWEKAGSINELTSLFAAVPPAIPEE